MSEFLNLTGLDRLEESLTPVEKWQVLKVLIEQEESRLDQLKKLASSFEQIVIDQFDAMENYEALKKDTNIVWQTFCPVCENSIALQIEIPAATIYQTLSGHVRVAETSAAHEAMRKCGYGKYLVLKVDQEKFGKAYKETLEENNDFQLPDILRPYVTIYQKYELRQRKNKI